MKGELVFLFHMKSDLLSGINITNTNDILVVDKANRCINVFQPGTSRPKARFGQKALCSPWDVTFLRGGVIAVSDPQDGNVKLFNSEGEFMHTIGAFRGDKHLKNPRGIAVDTEGHLLVADSGDKCVHIISSDGQNILHTIQGTKRDPLFSNPLYVTVNKITDDIIVSDYGDDCVKAFDHEGNFRFKYGADHDFMFSGHVDQESKQELVYSPFGVCCDNYGLIFIAEYTNQRVRAITVDGNFKDFVVARDDGLQYPRAIAVDRFGQLLVAEQLGTVKSYKYL